MIHRRQSLPDGYSGTFDNRVSQSRYSMITAHTPAFIPHQTPYRQHAMHTLLLMPNHRLHHVSILPGFKQIQKRMFCTVRIP